jgi:hypothetical protein
LFAQRSIAKQHRDLAAFRWGVLLLSKHAIAPITELREKVRCSIPHESIVAIRGVDWLEPSRK